MIVSMSNFNFLQFLMKVIRLPLPTSQLYTKHCNSKTLTCILILNNTTLIPNSLLVVNCELNSYWLITALYAFAYIIQSLKLD